MQMINLKPNPNTPHVRLEDGSGYLNKDGQRVPLTAYWRRRLMDRDVIEVADTPPPEQAPSEAAIQNQPAVESTKKTSK